MFGIDSCADTCCLGKHAYIREFIEGKSVNATGFSASFHQSRAFLLQIIVSLITMKRRKLISSK